MSGAAIMLPAWTLWRREITRFSRQPSRVVGALGPPILFWILIGSGIGSSFRPAGGPQGQGYLEYFFPGALVLVVLFTAIFSTISIIEDRREGFLQGVLVAPVSRLAIVLGKVLGGATLALGQSLLFLPLAMLAGIPLALPRVALLAVLLFVIGFGLTALGFVIAWNLESTQGFHAVMNLFLMPMWLLSGAAFPASGAPAWIAFVMRCNPLSYGVAVVRAVLVPHPEGPAAGFASAVGVCVLFAAMTTALAVASAGRRNLRGLA